MSQSSSSPSTSSTTTSSGSSFISKEYLAGAISGLGKVGAGHPFDTIKARVQAGRFATPREALVRTVKDEGVLALYQGCSMPTVNVCFLGGIIFSVNSAIKEWLQPDPTIRLTYPQMFYAGCGAGVVTGLVANPIEIVKINLQVANRAAAESGGAALNSAGAPQGIWSIMKRVGPTQLFGCGLNVTVVREIGTFGIFFPLNEILKDGMRVSRGEALDSRTPLPIPNRVAAAWAAGVVCWFPCYPVDVVKTKLQNSAASRSVGEGKEFGGAIDCARKIYKAEGMAVFWRGLTPCLLRAGPAYSAQYLLYEYASAYFRGQ